MASTTSAFSVLPIVGYVLLAIVLAYLGLRVFRYLKSVARTSGSLPKPVSGAAQKSAFVFGRSTGWDWRRWTLPRVPSWSRVPEIVKGKAKAVANAKNLSVELLPTTGLPPPPTSMATPQLVDLGIPATPPLTTGATSTSFPNSPRTPSPPFNYPQHPNSLKPLYPVPAHPSYPRPPSPHALLATTTPPKQHRRSRSLGGVPVRRLSGGTSGLRNAVEMKDLSAAQSHVRGTSAEHLLIDFSTSGSDDEDREGVSKISPAASDIGVLPSGKEVPPLVDARMVGRHVPLLNFADESPPNKVDEDSWKWFGAGPAPSLSYGLRSLVDSRPRDLVSFPLADKLVDVDSDSHPELALGSDSIQVRRLEVATQYREEELVDLSDRKAGVQMDVKEVPLVDLHEDYLDAEALQSRDIQLVDIKHHSDRMERSQSLPLPPPLPSQTPIPVKAAFSHPLEDLVHVDSQPQISTTPPAVSEKAEAQPGLLFAESQREPEPQHELPEDTSPLVDIDGVAPEHVASDSDPTEPPSPLIIPMSDIESQSSSQGGWAWDVDVDVDDPWGNHVADPSSPDSDVFIYTGMDAVSQTQEENRAESDLIVFDAPPSTIGTEETEGQEVLVTDQDLEVLDKSPGGSLFATVLPDEDEEERMPPLDLGGSLDESPLENLVDAFEQDPMDEEEEEVTPKPTPASVKLELPALTVDIPASQVPVIVVQDSLETESVAERCPDPDLLPLPESPLLMSVDAQGTEEVPCKEDGPEKKASLSQTPTPPASPPPISPSRFAGNKSRPPSPGGGVKGMGSMRLSPSPRLAVMFPLPAQTSPAEEKENETPTALTVGGATSSLLPVWPAKSADPPSLLSSPGVRRRVLVDVSAGGNVEGDKVIEQEQEKEPNAQHVHELKLSSSLPGSFPDPALPAVVSVSPSAVTTALSATNSPTTTIAARLALAPDTLTRQPSARTLVRSPLDIALAMQLRPGLGAGADPAWMVRFLMAMFGWFAVVVSGGEHF